VSEILDSYEIELVENLEELLDGFYQDLIGRGLKQSTVERHIINAELYLIEYHAFYFLGDVSSIQPEKIYDFLGTWYFQRVGNPTQSDMLSILTSLKRFINYLGSRKLIEQELKTQLIRTCSDKHYFLKCFEEFNLQPIPPIEDEPSDEELDMIASQYADRMTHVQDDSSLPDKDLISLDEMSLMETIEYVMSKFRTFHPKDNVISLEPLMPKSSASPPPSTLRQEEKPKKTLESLKQHCMTLHRSNLVFIRWLDRYNCHPSHLPSDAMEVCVTVDTLLTCLLTQLELENISGPEILQGHKMLDLMDQVLWAARHQIVQKTGLDLRLLPI